MLRNVMFVGGSVTQGAWASAGNSYADQLFRWLEARHGAINLRNIAIGGTDSQFAVYRLDGDLGDFRPDLAFIEFSINDRANDRSFVWDNIDALVFKLRQRNPDVVIVYIALTCPAERELRQNGKRDARHIFAEEICHRSGVFYVDAGYGLWEQVLGGGRDLSDFFCDTVHPNDLGHSCYFTAIGQALEEQCWATRRLTATAPPLVHQTGLDTARIVPLSDILRTSTRPLIRDDRWNFDGHPRSYFTERLCLEHGDEFSVSFTGRSFGLMLLKFPGGGQLICETEGGFVAAIETEFQGSEIHPQLFFDQCQHPSKIINFRSRGLLNIGCCFLS